MGLLQRVRKLSPEAAARRLASGELAVVDVRQPHEFAGGRIAGAVNIPLTQLGARVGELDPQRPVAFVCHTGMRSRRAARMAAGAGYDAVNVAGGMLAWARAGLPVARPRR